LANLPLLYPDERRKQGRSKCRDDDLGCIHVGIKQPPRFGVGGREFRKRYISVAIDRCSRSVHLAARKT